MYSIYYYTQKSGPERWPFPRVITEGVVGGTTTTIYELDEKVDTDRCRTAPRAVGGRYFVFFFGCRFSGADVEIEIKSPF